MIASARALLPRLSMLKSCLAVSCALLCLATVFVGEAGAQPPPEPPPLWDVAVGGSFVGTSGNTDTSTVGADVRLNRRWPAWQMEAAAIAISTSDAGAQTAERYLAAVRAKRQLSPLLGLSFGERAERDRFAGVDFRSILDGGLTWALVRQPRWTLDGVSSIAWNHEEPVLGPSIDHPVGVLQALNKFVLGPAADTTQRFTVFPDFTDSAAYRSEAEITAQAAMTNRLALKFGYLWRYSNLPVPGFGKSDSTTTASIVLRWRAANPAP